MARQSKRGGGKGLWEEANGSKAGHCRECGTVCTGRRRSWCSEACVETFRIRAWPGYARELVRRRDQGVCSDCGFDAYAFGRKVKDADTAAAREFLDEWNQLHPDRPRSYAGWRPGARAHERPRPGSYWEKVRRHRTRLILDTDSRLLPWWWRKTWWDCDHIKAVHLKGKNTLENLRTLCLVCHSKATGKQATARAAKKKKRRPPRKHTREERERARGR